MADHNVDIFNDKYEYIGISNKRLAHLEGLWHRVFTCIVINSDEKTMILQSKVPNQYSFEREDYLDISVGGHYKAGERIQDGIRELKEEIGIDVDFEELIEIGIRQTSKTISADYISNEFQHLFLYDSNRQLTQYKPDNKEVKELVEVPIYQGIDLLLGKIEYLEVKTFGIKDGNRVVSHKVITLKDFVPDYLTIDKFMMRLFITAKRYIEGEKKEFLFW
ncbi:MULTISPECIES: NUDIX hydrolase [Bacillus cereus group]|uniref:TetR family transcriptional regulator n=2 Tax=Bacillus cereus TaxID=1396 RepID=A0A2A8TXN7_BACCE|nr:NUDIX domain-containing protein [Bacillus cereus]PDY84277.1 TetR family transcriptional regulator [Bacillus cereus]PFA05162.1 TetR family transcriptional regulator [Bacillus cereus]PFM38339.1 TetR family transcriptional regulator [Bacillus cereus]PGL56333.1 TetR family transcriptional regulator [Bacillus cereus]PGQ05413.1 TetR family transcriptional regulator [Bacillus cereus]